ncbi:uncharacterized protein LOC107363093 [Tetranychus urticae]|uniref:uncharacterized protein LOC107363093 n=1 Tax=Tetranychus urticae TaxID=32264 RepID=UPI00077BE2D2|nr:uncharacterized protein LOC107363093 [Tetranychus urticae]
MKIVVLFIFIGYFVAFVYCDYYGSGFPANSPSLDPEPFVYKKIPIHYLSSTHGIGFAGYGGGDGPMRKYMGALSPYHHVGYPMPNYSYHHPKDLGSLITVIKVRQDGLVLLEDAKSSLVHLTTRLFQVSR